MAKKRKTYTRAPVQGLASKMARYLGSGHRVAASWRRFRLGPTGKPKDGQTDPWRCYRCGSVFRGHRCASPFAPEESDV
jgi:hypothetical protein